MAIISMKALLESGVHFGHRTNKWDPRMKPYIFTERNGIHIIDLQKSIVKLEEAATAMKQIAKSGRKILFVATKKQAKEIERLIGRLGHEEWQEREAATKDRQAGKHLPLSGSQQRRRCARPGTPVGDRGHTWPCDQLHARSALGSSAGIRQSVTHAQTGPRLNADDHPRW